ncbi:hypothetical protein AArcMg_0143 [Natrarchaeobaculum sulfurireducens]|uniref:Uncharacterized protein n=1 Tax=Natrarchaeobaculum sulfurireducens TaxID=2044521 RepID=A0A346PKX9_9EURY|nr:hypothetical protein AArcMg_0143 [Natrarchaeobaculum sulfurireducens]
MRTTKEMSEHNCLGEVQIREVAWGFHTISIPTGALDRRSSCPRSRSLRSREVGYCGHEAAEKRPLQQDGDRIEGRSVSERS